eukprot:scaffold1082_cov161-Prasinococcus_capsulatus_cf.AAC.1
MGGAEPVRRSHPHGGQGGRLLAPKGPQKRPSEAPFGALLGALKLPPGGPLARAPAELCGG